MADQASLRPAGPAHSRRQLTTLRPKEASDRIIHGRLASGNQRGPQIPLNACMKSSNAGSKPRPCCLQPKPPPCCSGRCSLAARSPCGKSTPGRASESHPPHCLLISSPDLVMSPKPETPQQQFPHHPRHDPGAQYRSHSRSRRLRTQGSPSQPRYHK